MARRIQLNMEHMNNRTRPVAQIYKALEREIFNQLATTFKYGWEAEPDLLEWQIDCMLNLRNIEESTIKKLAELSGRIEQDIVSAIVENAGDVIDDTDYFLSNAKVRVTPVKDVRLLVDSYIQQTFLEIDNYINETLITTNFGRGTLAIMFRNILNDVQIAFSAGHYTLDEAIERTLMQWVDKGVPSAFIDKGGHRWSLTRYVETVLRSTNSRIYNDLRTNRMREYGMVLVVMSSKLSAREACAPIQGKIIDISPDRQKPKYPNIYDYGYGEPWGTRGINCGHMWYPYKEGVNINNQDQYDPKEAVEIEKLNQQRNKMLRDIDKLEKKVDVAKVLESDNLAKYRQRLRAKRSQLKNFDVMLKDRKDDFYYRSTKK